MKLFSVKTPEKCTDVEMQSVSYEEFIDNTKNNKPVIILHGLLGSKENWNSLAKQLNRRIGRKVSHLMLSLNSRLALLYRSLVGGWSFISDPL